MSLNYKILNPKRNIYYSIGIPVGAVLLIPVFPLYERTLIHPIFLAFLLLIISALTTLADRSHYQSTYSLTPKWSLFFCAATNMFMYGFTSLTLFLALNFYGGPNTQLTEDYPIIERVANPTRGGLYYPIFTVQLRNGQREVPFHNSYFPTMEIYSKVQLTTRPGLFGFTVITDKELVE